ncbi:MAG: hypothetical protein ACRDCH_02700 [Metamycoplasmataceae bacterium]
MIINFKKLALGIMVAGGLVVPLAVVASCSSSKTVDLKIKTKSSVTLVREDIWANKYKELTTLKKVFEGVSESELEKVEVRLETIVEGQNYRIVLTAKEGYTINGKASLNSIDFQIPTENLVITEKETIPTEIPRNDVVGDNLKTITTLSKFFNLPADLTQEELDESVDVKLQKATTRQDKWIIILTAKPGFTIGGQTILTSEPFDIEIVNLIIEKIDPAPTGITADDIAGEKFKTFEFLSLLFRGEGFTRESIKNMDIKMQPIFQGVYTITLTPLEGFTINGSTAGFVSSNFVVGTSNLVISAKSDVPKNITQEEIEAQNIKRVEFLGKLFEGVDLTQPKIDEGIVVSLNPISSDNLYKRYTITLTAKNGFTIGGMPSLTSNQFTLQVNLEGMLSKTLDPFSILADEIAGDNFKSFATLIKLFVFDSRINSTNVEEIFNITKEEIEGETNTWRVTLIAKDGFVIDGVAGGKILLSDSIRLTSNYVISANSNITPFKPSEINGDKYKEFSVLSKLFSGNDFHEDMLNTLDITLNLDGANYTITLKPTAGFTINGSTEGITSNSFTAPKENIVIGLIEQTPTDITSEQIENPDFIKTRAFLSRLFVLDDSWTQERLDSTFNVRSERNDFQPGIWQIVLTLIDPVDFEINGQPFLFSNIIIVEVMDLNIQQRSGSLVLDAQDIEGENYKSFNTLVKLFDFGTIPEPVIMQAFIVSMNPMTGNDPRIIILNVNPGFTINGQATLDSNEFTLGNNLEIEIQTPAPTDITWDQIEGENFKDISVLEKLFTGIGLTEPNLEHLDITRITIQDQMRYKIALAPKPGYSLNGDFIPLESLEFTLQVSTGIPTENEVEVIIERSSRFKKI